MNFDLTEKQRMIRDTVREFAENEVKPAAADIGRMDEFPRKIYRRMAAPAPWFGGAKRTVFASPRTGRVALRDGHDRAECRI